MRPISTLRRAALLAAAAAAGCAHDTTSPAVTVELATPDLVCVGASVSSPSGATTVALTGDGFTPMPSETLTDPRRLRLPRITLGPAAALPGGTLPPAAVEITDEPTAAAASRVRWTSEQAMSFDVVPADALPPGVFDLTVTNPDGKHAATRTAGFAMIPPPLVAMAAPMAICDDQSDQTVVVTGSNFLVYDGHAPTVTLGAGADAKTYAATVSDADCAAIPAQLAEAGARLCTALTIVVPAGDFQVTAATDVPLVVTNPAPADCASSSSPATVTIEPPPRVDAVAPASVCQGGSTITVTGAGFMAGATVSLVCGGPPIPAASVTVAADGTSLTASFGPSAAPGTSCQVIVHNPDGCEDRPLPHEAVTVVAGPVVFLVDPEVVYNGVNTRITIFATTITQPLASNAVAIRPAGGGAETMLAFNAVPGHPNRLQAIVPQGQAPGVYDLRLADATGCDAVLPNALTVTATTTVTLKSVRPPFGDTNEDTSIEVFRDTAAPAPGDHPFVDPPRVYLEPTNPSATDIAVPLESVAFLDGNRVTGVVPEGTPPHAYDVILVNPDGTVGVLPAGFTELATPPPTIDAATPSSIVAATGQQVLLTGRNFATGDAVALTCVDAAGMALAPPAVVAAAPACTPAGCTQAITINASALTAGSICVVRVTNPDGAYGEYSAIGVTNSSLNLNAPHPGPDLVVGRRALVAAAGNATSTNRFVYAIGGDTGAAAGALASVEFAAVDPFGTIDAFVVQPYALRAPRTLAGATTIGRYVYVVGGNDGTGAVATAERALILSPRETPVISDLDVILGEAGLEPGEYRYRVSAVMADADGDNPGGETLASDEFTVKIPAVPGAKVSLTLLWKPPVDVLGAPLPNVIGYRVYRTRVAGDAPGTEVLLGAAPVTTALARFTDDGTLTPGTATPLPLGATGRWAALPALAIGREGPGVIWAPDPVTARKYYVYAGLGRSAAGASASYEFLTVTAAANGRQTVSASWTTGALGSAQGRWQLGAWLVDGTVAAQYAAPATTVFFGGGLTATGAAAGKIESGTVTAGGQLASGASPTATVLDDTPRDFAVNQAGYGVCAANGQLFSFGGVNATPQPKAKSTKLGPTPPSLGAWNDEGLSMTHGRYLMGSAVQSAFIFLLGGQTDEPSAASKSTELVILVIAMRSPTMRTLPALALTAAVGAALGASPAARADGPAAPIDPLAAPLPSPDGAAAPTEAAPPAAPTEAAPAAAPEAPPAAPSPPPPPPPPRAADARSVLVGVKAGGIVPLDGLSPFVSAGVELGYVLPVLDHGLALVLAADYTQPTKTGVEMDPRVTGGSYAWKLTEQELGVMPVLVYRLRSLRWGVPYAGVGPRVVFHRSTVESAAAPAISPTVEQSAKFGVGVPIGVDLPAGPGRLVGELLLQYGALDHTATGDSHSGATSLSVGYRLML